tara:strand:+ start:525 stop:968 length:444 start_codon:yes stop_codon:yes gene_type:complete
MNRISQKKLIISYLITSATIFIVSGIMQFSGTFNGVTHEIFGSSVALAAASQLMIVLALNFLLHAVFYFGGFNSSPITKGVGIGSALGIFYFAIGLFVFQAHSIDSAPIGEVAVSLGGNVVEYSLGGILTAVISVSDIHKWGLLRAF